MAFTQHILSCVEAADLGMHNPAHPDGDPACTVIACTRDADSLVVWHSHETSAVDPTSRLNPDVTTVKDWR